MLPLSQRRTLSFFIGGKGWRGTYRPGDGPLAPLRAILTVAASSARIAFAEEQIQTDEHLLKLIRQRFDAGVSTDREVAQAEALLAQARASVPPLRTLLESQLNRLDVLMGVQPGTLLSGTFAECAHPESSRNWIVECTFGRFTSASGCNCRRAPTGGFERGYRCGHCWVLPEGFPVRPARIGKYRPGHRFQSVAFQPQSVAGLRWRIFDFGRVSAEIAGAKGANAEALAAYRQSVLHAAEDVEDAFMLLTQSEVRERQVLEEVNSLKRVRDRSQESYLVGVLALTDVLDAHRQLLIAQDELALTRETSARAAVGSFRALGGGWTP